MYSKLATHLLVSPANQHTSFPGKQSPSQLPFLLCRWSIILCSDFLGFSEDLGFALCGFVSIFTSPCPEVSWNPPFNASIFLDERDDRLAGLIFCKVNPYKFQLLLYDQSTLAKRMYSTAPREYSISAWKYAMYEIRRHTYCYSEFFKYTLSF